MNAAAELETFELEESGQLSIGVEGEQRALEGLAPAGTPAPIEPLGLFGASEELERRRHELDKSTGIHGGVAGDCAKCGARIGWSSTGSSDGQPRFISVETLSEYCEPEPEAIDARAVPCPDCGARAGVYCRRPSGHKAWSPHAARMHAAELAATEPELEESPPLPTDEPADWEDPEYDRAQRPAEELEPIADETLELLERAGVQPERIEAMRQTRDELEPGRAQYGAGSCAVCAAMPGEQHGPPCRAELGGEPWHPATPCDSPGCYCHDEPEPTPPRDDLELADRDAEELELEEELADEERAERRARSSSRKPARREYACGDCGRKLPHEEWVYSRHTGARYCTPGQGCQTPAAYAKQERDRARARAQKG